MFGIAAAQASAAPRDQLIATPRPPPANDARTTQVGNRARSPRPDPTMELCTEAEKSPTVQANCRVRER